MENSGTFDAVLEHDLRFLITVLRLCSALPQLRSVGINLLRLASISWARPKIIEHGLSLGSFCWAQSQIWHQLILSVASGGLRSASVEVSWYQFFEHDQRLLSTVSDCPHFTEHGLKFGLRLASALPQVVSTLPQLLWVTSIFWTRQNLAEHGLTLASSWHQYCLRWSPHCLNCFEWHQFSEHKHIWLSTVSNWPQVGISIASNGLCITSTALSDIIFLNTAKFGWARSHFGLMLASVEPQHCLKWPKILSVNRCKAGVNQCGLA